MSRDSDHMENHGRRESPLDCTKGATSRDCDALSSQEGESGEPQDKLTGKPRGALIARNSVILVAVEVIAKILGMLVFVWMARTVGARELGIYGFAISLCSIAALLPRFGFERYVQREVPRKPQDFPVIWATILSIKLPLCIPASLVVLAVLWITGSDPAKTTITLLILAAMLLCDFLWFHAACFRAFQRAPYEAYARMLFSGVYVSLSFIALRAGLGVTGIAVALILAAIAAVSFSVRLLHYRIYPLTFAVDRSSFRRVITTCVPFFLLMLIVMIHSQFDVLLLSFLADDYQVGIYVAAMKIFETTSLIPAGIMGAVLPALSRDWSISKAAFSGTFATSFRYLTVIGLPIAAGGSLCATGLLSLLYGSQYNDSGAVLTILIWTVIFSFWNHLLFTAMIAMDRERPLIYISLGGVLMNLALNLVLIPRLGAIGSSIAMVGAQAFLMAITVPPVFAAVPKGREIAISLLRPCLCTALMLGTLWTMQTTPVIVRILVAMVVYSLAILSSGAVAISELRTLRGATPPA